MSFAGFQVGGAQQAVDFSIDTPVSGSLEDYPLIGKLLEAKEYKELYYKYLNEAINLYFDSGVFSSSIDKLDKLINPYVKNDATAFTTYEQYEKSLPVLKEFGKLRGASVTAQLAGNTTSSTVSIDISALGSIGGGMNGAKMPVNGQGGLNIGVNAPPDNQGNAPKEGNQQNEVGAAVPANGQGGFIDGNMPNMENIQEAMKIIEEAQGGELTEEQLEKLKELGFDEAMIERFKNRSAIGDRQNPNGNAIGNNQGGFPNRQDGFNRNGMGNNGSKLTSVNSQNLKTYGIIIGVSALFMTAGIIFALNFKKRRYASKHL